MKKILVPTDFSQQAKNATDFAIKAAKKAKAEIILVHVLEHPSYDTFNTMGIAQKGYDPMENIYLMKMMESSKAKLEEIIMNPDYKEVNLKYKIIIGNPFKEIAKEITDFDAELVVMGTSGVEGFAQSVLGSNVEKVIRNAKCPVISIRREADLDNINDIVFASDFVNPNDKLIEHIKNLQAFFDAKLRLVRINTPNSFTSSRHDSSLMRSFVEKHEIKNYTLDIYNASLEEEGIIYFSEDIKADMIALGTHGRTGLAGLISGSIAEDVANHARRPVWTFKIK